jgi:cell wall-associated NlpC family hydrolase
LPLRRPFLTLAVVAIFLLNLPGVSLSVPTSPGNLPLANSDLNSTLNSEESTTTPITSIEQIDTSDPVKAAAQAKQLMNKLSKELEIITEEYLGAKLKLANTQNKLENTKNRLRWLEAELEAQRQILNERIVNIYKHGQINPFELVIDNEGFANLLARFGFLIRLGVQDAELIQKIHRQKRKIEETKKRLQELQGKQIEISSSIEQRKREIEFKLKNLNDLITRLDQEAKEILENQARQEAALQQALKKRLLNPANRPKFVVEPGSVVYTALQYLGVPYVWGGETPAGFDCSGLVRYVFKQHGVDLPHYSRAQAKLGIPVTVDQLQPGDLVFFGTPIHHVAIYIGDDYIVEAPQTGEVVKISRLSQKEEFVGARRILLNH